MSAAHLHLAVVHLPVILCPLGLLLLVIDAARDGERSAVGYGLLMASGLAGIVAYYSGPSAYEQLSEILAAEKELVEQHAVIARAAFVAAILAGVLALQAVLRRLQEEPVAKGLRVAVLVTALVASYLLAWSAHLGGQIRHPEIRQAEIFFFPRLPD